MEAMNIEAGDSVEIPVWGQTVTVLEVREKHDEVHIEMEDGSTSWEGLTWLEVKGEP